MILRAVLTLTTLFLFHSMKGVSIPPAPLQNYAPIVIVNNTTLPASEVYFVAYGEDVNGITCFLVPDASGIGQYSYPSPTGSASSAGSSKTLDQLPTADIPGLANGYLFYMPLNVSGRAYFSIKSPMFLKTSADSNGIFTVSAAPAAQYNDPNFYTFNSFIEFVLETVGTTSAVQCYLDLSWVDYFSLPMQVAAYSYPGHTTIISPNPPVQPVLSVPSGTISGSITPNAQCTLSTITRECIINTALKTLTTEQSQNNPSWGNVGIPYYNNQYTDSTPATYLRLLAAKHSIGLGEDAHPFQKPNVPITYFPANYVHDAAHGPGGGLSFMEAAWLHYSVASNTFYTQIYPANLTPTIYSITALAGTGPISKGGNGLLTITFQSSNGGPTVSLDLSTLSTSKLLSGSVWPFYPAVNVAYTNELSKLVSGLFGIGQFPTTGISTSPASPFSNSTVADPGTTIAFTSYPYFNNPSGFSNGPWYNLFCKALHTQMVSPGVLAKNPTLGQGYAYDFDDLLGISGTIAGIYTQDTVGNPTKITPGNPPAKTCSPYFVVSLESLQGSTIPDIANDTYAYKVTVDSSVGGVAVVYNWYDSSFTLHNTTAPTTGTLVLNNVDTDNKVRVKPGFPFSITFTFPQGGPSYTYNINLLRQLVVPNSITSTFSDIDVTLQSGVVFSVTGSGDDVEFEIAVDSTPLPWPG